jgi:hypothetical protein
MRKRTSGMLLLLLGAFVLYYVAVGNRSRLPPAAALVQMPAAAAEQTIEAAQESPAAPRPDTAANGCEHHAQILARLGQLAETQSNLEASVARILDRLGDPRPGGPVAVQRQQELRRLEQFAAEHQRQTQAARMKVIDLITQLNPPDEVAIMEPKTGLALPSMKHYWPYFEARREQDKWDLVAERLELRMIQERIDGDGSLP